MQNTFLKVYTVFIGILLTVIGFFLSATYSKINETNVMVYHLQIELAAIRAHESQFMTYQETAALIDKKILQYHRESTK